MPSAPRGGNAAIVNDTLERMDRFAPVEDTQDLAAKPLVAQVIAQEETPQELPQGIPVSGILKLRSHGQAEMIV